VVFDSYEKLHDAPVRRSNTTSMAATEVKGKGGGWYSEYGNSENRHVVFYDGIGPVLWVNML
jgi:NTE family protein